MKRSEMVKLVTDYLEPLMESHLDYFREELEDTVECLISLIESKGMKPPGYVCHADEWEPENE